MREAPSPYISLFFEGLSCEVDEAAIGLASAYRMLEMAQTDNGLTLYMVQTPEPAVPLLFLGALGGLFHRRR